MIIEFKNVLLTFFTAETQAQYDSIAAARKKKAAEDAARAEEERRKAIAAANAELKRSEELALVQGKALYGPETSLKSLRPKSTSWPKRSVRLRNLRIQQLTLLRTLLMPS